MIGWNDLPPWPRSWARSASFGPHTAWELMGDGIQVRETRGARMKYGRKGPMARATALPPFIDFPRNHDEWVRMHTWAQTRFVIS